VKRDEREQTIERVRAACCRFSTIPDLELHAERIAEHALHARREARAERVANLTRGRKR